MKKYKILCVDDDLNILKAYSDMLASSEYEIVTFSSCLKAINFILENGQRIIYIFSDYSMKEMNGLEFRKKVNELGHDIPFSIVTGYYSEEMSISAMALGVSAFIEKPMEGTKLISLIDAGGLKRKAFLEEEYEMIISFIEESHPMLLEIEDLIMSLEATPESSSLLNTYFRLLHTIKGTASCVGLKNIPKFAHKYEDLVVKLKEKHISLTPEVANALLKGLDHLKYMYAEAKIGCFESEVEEALHIFDLDRFSDLNQVVVKKEVNENKKISIHASNETTEEKIGVSVSVLNNFMELSGQLTVIRNTLIKSAIILEQRYHGDNEIEILSDSLDEMHKVSSVLQNDIAEMRKISLEVVYKPLKRVIRDSSKSLNKEIDFHVDGESLRVDTAIGKVLSNSLVHMIRNSIDHGIEMPDSRIKAGKLKTGNISLKSFQDGENIIVILSDDGNGLNLNRIKQKAIEKNLFSEDQLKIMSDQRIFSLIFDSGFSTAQQVSDISGRGVGMDMVKSSIESVGGKIIIDSKEGCGTSFTLTLPIPRSVLIIKSLMIRSKDATFSIPLDEVAEVVRLEDFRESKILHSIEQSLMFCHHDELLPLIDLNHVLCGKWQYDQFEIMNIVIVRSEGYKYGIIVDEIMDIEEIVVKKLSRPLKNATCFMGVTFLGHGALALILNLAAIAEKSHIKNSEDSKMQSNLQIEAKLEIQDFMLFNMKKSKNYSFPLHVVNRLEEISTSDIEYAGAVPLVRYRGETMPLLFIERQLELCPVDTTLSLYYPEILKVIVVDLHNKQYGIVVDEILDIGTTSDQLNTHNVDRDGFIGTIFIEEKTSTILDVHFLVNNYIRFEKDLLEKENTETQTDLRWTENKAA